MLIEQIQGAGPWQAFLALRPLGSPFLINGTSAPAARYSYAGAGPLTVITTENGATTIDGALTGRDPFEALSGALAGMTGAHGPFPFCSGAAGYFSYDLKGLIEPSRRFAGKDGLGIPDCVVGIYDPVFVYDHAESRGYLCSAAGRKERVAEQRALIEAGSGASMPAPGRASAMRSDMTREGYILAVKRAKEYISSGDIYQINLSQRLSMAWEGDPFGLYLALAGRYQAPCGSFFDHGGFQIISNSPERLLKVSGGAVETRPIKGTRRRGATAEEDRALIGELKASPKEAAEHVMIVDLERSDLGRVCSAGTIEVAGFRTIETYPHLHHMVSTVRGVLKPGVDAPAALRAIFPGGSITGAPKVRAMEIIDELEASARSVYTGAIGWFDSGGAADVAMAIRTAVRVGGSLYLSVGGGIVADSVPEDEYDETLLKARDFLESLGMGAAQ